MEEDWSDDDWGNGEEDASMEDDAQIAVENLFYQAEDERKRDPAAALLKFQEAYDLEVQSGAMDDVVMRFKALQYIVTLNLGMGNLSEAHVAYKALLDLIAAKRVSRNEGNQAIQSILGLAAASEEQGADALFESTLHCLEQDTSEYGERNMFHIAVMLCRLYQARGDTARAHRLLERMHQLCRLPDGTDDPSKGAQLLDMYALTMQLLPHNDAQIQEIVEKTRNLDAEVRDPRSMSIIQECWGKSFGNQGNWDRAYTELWEAFVQYQQIGDASTKRCLQYVILASMLCSNDVNPFSSREAKVLEHDPAIAVLVILRDAFDRQDVGTLTQLLHQHESTIFSDPFVHDNVKPLIEEAQAQAILKDLGPFQRVRLDRLVRVAGLRDVAEAERMARRLILDHRLCGSIDESMSVLVLDAEEPEPSVSLQTQWSHSITHLQSNIGKAMASL